MKVTLLILLITATNVIGYEEMYAAPGEFPYHVSINDRGEHHCSGSIFDRRWILTAAHCFENKTSDYVKVIMKVIIGVIDLDKIYADNMYGIEKIIVHEDFTATQLSHHDVAILKVDREIIYTKDVKPVILDKVTNSQRRNEKTIFDARISGWRKMGSTNKLLRYINLSFISNRDCQMHWERYSRFTFQDYNSTIRESNICALNRVYEIDCFRDSGAPLVEDSFQIGIFSFMTPCARGTPDVFTRVSSYFDWITNRITNSL